jgi:hypothetical protein
VAAGKPVSIASFDDFNTRRHFDIEVTAVRVKP